VAVAGLAGLGAVVGSASAGTAAHPAVTGGGVPRLSAPTVSHVPDAWEMQGVSCISASHCVAVGNSAASSSEGLEGVLVPITNGKLGKPLITTDGTSSFYGVSCITATRCVVAGQAEPTPTSEEEAALWLWHSGKLTYISQSTPTVATSSMFRGVDCRSAITCSAVGDALYKTKIASNQPIAVFGTASLSGLPSDAVVLNDTAGYAASIYCPNARICYAGGSTPAGGAEEIRIVHGPTGYVIHGIDQPTISGLEGVACVSVSSCEASGDQDLPMLGQFQGWLEHLTGFATGTTHEVVGTEQLFSIAAVNPAGYLAVGYSGGANWVTDLVSASGHASAINPLPYGGYLQSVTCPVQTECVAVGFTNDSAASQPGGQDGVDGAIAIFHLKTPPSAPKVRIKSVSRRSETVHLTAPSSNGGVAITGYRLAVGRCKPHHAKCRLEAVKAVHLRAHTRTVKVKGLKPHTTYYFAADATNAIGTGPYSPEAHKKTK
jgi:hypothetical protein